MSPIKSISHSASGASCEIYEWGATVTSFKVASGRECLFVSRDAKLDGSKAIRGGIPLVFPQFGQPDKSMPQHAFLRNNYWKFDESSAYDNTDSAGISLTLDLKDVKNSRGGKLLAAKKVCDGGHQVSTRDSKALRQEYVLVVLPEERPIAARN